MYRDKGKKTEKKRNRKTEAKGERERERERERGRKKYGENGTYVSRLRISEQTRDLRGVPGGA